MTELAMGQSGQPHQGRVVFLDGMRGIAVLAVVVFHIYGPVFFAYKPYGYRYSYFFPIRFGWMGVELFFLISGFVILMTLERCSGLLEFARRRWLRLFPAMLIASSLILAYDRLVHGGPWADRSLGDLIPGLTFLSPALLHTLTRARLQSMDVPFWSLYVEVIFYAIFGIAFTLRGWKVGVGVVAALAAVSVGGEYLHLTAGSSAWRLENAMTWLGFIFFGWFASGALFFKAYQRQDARLFWTAVAIGAASAVTMRVGGMSVARAIGLLVVVALFAASMRLKWLEAVLTSRALVFLGFVSYPLYLIHMNIVIGTTHLLGGQGKAWAVLLPLIPLSAVVTVAWLIAAYAEPRLRWLLRRAIFLETRSKSSSASLDKRWSGTG